MILQVKRFGEILSSRPDGREAALVLLANELRNTPVNIEIDFSGVLVMTPSWLGEFVDTLRPRIPDITFIESKNASVIGSIEILKEMDSKAISLLNYVYKNPVFKDQQGRTYSCRIGNYPPNGNPYAAEILVGINGTAAVQYTLDQFLALADEAGLTIS